MLLLLVNTGSCDVIWFTLPPGCKLTAAAVSLAFSVAVDEMQLLGHEVTVAPAASLVLPCTAPELGRGRAPLFSV